MDNREIERKIWFTSDLHFGHDKEFLWGARGFKSIAEHDRMVIANWNALVGEDDDVYVLGDLMLGSQDYGLCCISELHGRIHIIAGNHDTDAKMNRYFLELGNNVRSIRYADRLRYKHWEFYLSHYPMIVHNEQNHEAHIWNLHGHTHSKDKFSYPHCYNVALDAHDNKPVEITEILEDIKNFYNNKDNIMQ